MNEETVERWRQLCEQAIREEDPDKLMQIVKEIDLILEAKEKRLASGSEGAREEGAA